MSMENLGPYSNFHELNQDWFLNEFNKVLEQWKAMQRHFDSLQDAFNDLKSYVQDYFKNLDVQEEINNKLNDMINDGTLSQLLETIVGSDSFPTFVKSISDMTNKRKVYVLSSNGHIYYYDENNWKDSGLVYGSFHSYSPSDILITKDNIDTYFNDLNKAPLNKTIYLYDIPKTLMLNLPVSVAIACVSTFQFSNTEKQPGGYQLFVGNDDVYIRTNTGSLPNFNWHDWIKLTNDITYKPSNILITKDDIDTYFNDLNKAPQNKTIYLYDIPNTLMLNLPVSVATACVSTFQFSNNEKQPGGYQLFVGNDEVYIRTNTGSLPNFNWHDWIKLTNENKCYPIGFNLFRKFCVVGDSLSVGYHTLKNGNIISEDKNVSWASYIKNKYNNEVYWSGKSGATCYSWLNENSETWGLKYTKKIGEIPLYVLCMGANETGQTIGSESDIGTNNPTLYAYVSKVIEELKKISPSCFIISTGISRGMGKTESVINVNTVYKNMEKHFDKYFYMDCINEFNSSPFTELYNNYHYTPIGYNAMSELYLKKFNNIIKENLTQFLYA